MKQFNKIAIFAIGAAAFGLTPVTAQVSTTCGNRNNKVLICHIPPGNPANAHTICVSPNAVPAHLQGNNSHNDFLGDCFGGCLGMSVQSYTQGFQSNGAPVLADRSDISKVLGTPDKSNAVGGFYSLGFGGEIIIQMDGFILNRPGNDITIYETSFGQPACDNYRERAEISVSPDLISWQTVGTICQDGSVNIGTFDYIRFVKIKDVTLASDFGNTVVDGFDVDGIQCIPPTSGARLAGVEEMDHATELDLHIFPNPADNQVSLSFEGTTEGEKITLSLMDLAGRVIRTEVIRTNESSHLAQVNISDLTSGIYMLHITGDRFDQMHKIIKK